MKETNYCRIHCAKRHTAMQYPLLVVVLLSIGQSVWATQPPPPQIYELTVNKSGGSSCTKVNIDSPEATDCSAQVQRSYVSGTEIEVDHCIECMCPYELDEWQSNDDELDGWNGHHPRPFTITKDTTATAVFVQRDLPDEESTTWKEHWTENPHRGDVYEHQISMSSDPTHKFTGMTINEDFLKAEMTTTGWTLSQADKDAFQSNWDDDWDIDSNNKRTPVEGDDDPDNAFDGHGFNRYVQPWSLMGDGNTFQIIQRMRVKSPCTSVNNSGPWFKTHPISFKLIVNQQTGQREVFVTKSGVQGPGDPQI